MNQLLDYLLPILFIEIFLLMTPIFFVALDFRSGVRKAKERGEKISSHGWRRSLTKVNKYYNSLFALLIIDVMQLVGLAYLNLYYQYNVPLFPWLTFIGAAVIAAIELRSIAEPANDKEEKEMKEVTALAKAIVEHRTDPQEIAKAVADYLSSSKTDD